MLRNSSLAFLAAASLAACSGAPPMTMTPPATSAVTFHEHVEPILQQRCQKCHRDGGLGPFSLTTYALAKENAPIIAHQVETRAMPPWGQAESAECAPRHKFIGDPRLTDDEVKTITTWARGGTPEGDPAKAPAAKTFPPDGLPGATHALSADAAYKVVPSSKDEIRCFPADPKFDTDAWISGTNVVPGNNKVVHHVIVYVDPRRESFKKAGAAGSYPCFGGPGVANASLLVAWAPGVPPADYGADSAVRVAKGSGLVIQIHYHPATTEQADQTKVELRRRDQPPAWAAVVALNGNADSANPGPDGNPVKLLPGPNDPPAGPSFIIPAGMKGHTEAMEFVMPDKVGGNDLPDLRLAGVGSHMHWVGKNMVIGVERKSPQGEPAKECLLETPRYDFNWQRGYGYDASIDRLPILRAGDKLTFKCTYDNSMGNPYVVKALREKNLSAPVDVRLGEETLDEMCLGAFVLLFRNQ